VIPNLRGKLSRRDSVRRFLHPQLRRFNSASILVVQMVVLFFEIMEDQAVGALSPKSPWRRVHQGELQALIGILL